MRLRLPAPHLALSASRLSFAQALGAHGALEESPGKSWPAARSSGARKNACASLHFTTESETWRGRLVVGCGTTSGISSHVRPSSTRPAYFLFLPPHCLKAYYSFVQDLP